MDQVWTKAISRLWQNQDVSGDDELKGWRDFRRISPIPELNELLHRSDDSGWVATRELLARNGWTDLHRLAVISGRDTRGEGGIYVLLPDETVADVGAKYSTYRTCSVQEFADWDVQFAEPLWNAVVWMRYQMREMRGATRSLQRSDDAKWQALRQQIEAEGLDPSKGVVAELWPDQGEEIGRYIDESRRVFSFEIPYGTHEVTDWDEVRHVEDMKKGPVYSRATWLLEASEGKVSDWIFRRPYAWKDKVKPGWHPPFGDPTFATPEEAALVGLNKEVVRIGSKVDQGESLVEIVLEIDADESGHFPITVVCELLPHGQWHQKSFTTSLQTEDDHVAHEQTHSEEDD